MSNILFHMAAGFALAAILALPGIWDSWSKKGPLFPRLLNWTVLSCILGGWFAVPSALIKMHILSGPLGGLGWNVFGLHPLLDALWNHTTILGMAAFTGFLALHYLLIVAAIFRAGHHLPETIAPAKGRNSKA
jgi:hypothetical protein